MIMETQEEITARTSVIDECKRQLLKEELSKEEAKNLMNFLHIQLSYKEYQEVCVSYENKGMWNTAAQVRPLIGNH